jgi:hypothetical protein
VLSTDELLYLGGLTIRHISITGGKGEARRPDNSEARAPAKAEPKSAGSVPASAEIEEVEG